MQEVLKDVVAVGAVAATAAHLVLHDSNDISNPTVSAGTPLCCVFVVVLDACSSSRPHNATVAAPLVCASVTFLTSGHSVLLYLNSRGSLRRARSPGCSHGHAVKSWG